jgi:hypothetical protein
LKLKHDGREGKGRKQAIPTSDFAVSSLSSGMGEMRRAVAREEGDRLHDRFASTLVIAAAIIAAVRLARDSDISRSSPRLFSVIAESVSLARLILKRVTGAG